MGWGQVLGLRHRWMGWGVVDGLGPGTGDRFYDVALDHVQGPGGEDHSLDRCVLYHFFLGREHLEGNYYPILLIITD